MTSTYHRDLSSVLFSEEDIPKKVSGDLAELFFFFNFISALLNQLRSALD
jgi:hypothetical protein